MIANQYTIVLETDEDREAVIFLHARLSEFNVAHTGDSFYRSLVIVARGAQGEIIGGVAWRYLL